MTRSASRRVVVTGWGVASPLGTTRAEFGEALLAGRSAGATIRSFDASAFPSQIAAEVPAFDLARRCPDWALGDLAPSCDRKLELGLLAAWEALQQANLPPDLPLEGLSLGTGLSSVLPAELEQELLPFLDAAGHFDHGAFAQRGLGLRWAAPRHDPGRAVRLLATLTGAQGPRATHFAACAASAQALGHAASWVARGRAERVLAGGMDSMIHPLGLASFTLLGTLTTRNDAPHAASRPFDHGRDGFLVAEGAAMLVLESLDSARARGATPLMELLGCGTSLDAYQATAPHPEGRGAELAMRRALQDAGLTPADVGYVNAHGTGTELNDPVEIKAFRRVFGAAAERVPISSTKSMHGHLIGAAGALEACAVLVALQRQCLPPTINIEEQDPECPADVVPNVARPAALQVATSNSFGFAGQNACLVFGALA